MSAGFVGRGDEGRYIMLKVKCKCGHLRLQHIYGDGACRPGFVCENRCEEFTDESMSTERMTPERRAWIKELQADGFFRDNPNGTDTNEVIDEIWAELEAVEAELQEHKDWGELARIQKERDALRALIGEKGLFIQLYDLKKENEVLVQKLTYLDLQLEKADKEIDALRTQLAESRGERDDLALKNLSIRFRRMEAICANPDENAKVVSRMREASYQYIVKKLVGALEMLSSVDDYVSITHSTANNALKETEQVRRNLGL